MWNPVHLWVTMLGVGFLKRPFLCLSCHFDVVLLSFVVEQIFSWGFPDSLAGKDSACNAGDISLILGSERSPRKGIGYPFQYSWVSLVAQMVKNLPAMPETLVQSLCWEDLLEEGMQPTLVFLPGEPTWTEMPGRLQSMGSQRVGQNWVTKHSTAGQVFSWFSEEINPHVAVNLACPWVVVSLGSFYVAILTCHPNIWY